MRSQPNAIPPCGGGPYWNASSRKPNFSCASSLVDAQHREDPLLHVAAVDTDRAAADLVAVADDVVGVGQGAAPGRPRTGRSTRSFGEVNGWCTAVQRRPDRDVVVLVDRLEHRGVDDPHERPGAARRSARSARAISSRGGAEQRTRVGRRARRRRRCSRPARRRRPRPGRRARRRRGSWRPGRRARRPRRPARRPGRGPRAAWPTPARRRAAGAAAPPRPASRRRRRTRPGTRGTGCRRSSR